MEDIFYEDVFQHIIEYLEPRDILKLGWINQSIREKYSDTTIWKKMIVRDYNKKVNTDNPRKEYFDRKLFPIGSCIRRDDIIKLIPHKEDEVITCMSNDYYEINNIEEAINLLREGEDSPFEVRYDGIILAYIHEPGYISKSLSIYCSEKLKKYIIDTLEISSYQQPDGIVFNGIRKHDKIVNHLFPNNDKYEIGYNINIKEIISRIPSFDDEVTILNDKYRFESIEKIKSEDLYSMLIQPDIQTKECDEYLHLDEIRIPLCDKNKDLISKLNGIISFNSHPYNGESEEEFDSYDEEDESDSYDEEDESDGESNEESSDGETLEYVYYDNEENIHNEEMISSQSNDIQSQVPVTSSTISNGLPTLHDLLKRMRLSHLN